MYILALFITNMPLPRALGASYEFAVEVIVVCWTTDRRRDLATAFVRKDVDRCMGNVVPTFARRARRSDSSPN
jgi:hypothetical protein